MKEQIEEFKFQKEMDKAREKMLNDMEKNKQKAMVDSEAVDRIKKRQEDLLSRKTEAIWKKKNTQDRNLMFELGMKESKEAGMAAELKEKVNSKLLIETKAQADKKRTKYDPKKDGPGKNAMTMGGNLLGVAMRAQAGWREGI